MILVVDDSIPQARALSVLLKNAGYPAPLMAHSAEAVLQQLTMPNPDAPIDLILLDLNMPDVNGIELCRRIKALPRWSDLPVIMVTSSTEMGDLQQAFDAGAMDYITKPPNGIELLARVRSALKLHTETEKRKAREHELLDLSEQLASKNEALTEMNASMEKMFDTLAEHHSLLQAEQDKSERLLLNVLPKAIAARLKQTQGILADSFPEATVLFADIVDFTPLSARLRAEDIVALLNDVFSVFDRLAEKYGLEKIKTIGDAYMLVGGVPTPRPDHVEAVADMALEMRSAFSGRTTGSGKLLSVRIGIHTGSVVAGVIGEKKFIYDLWGDTVNLASRMESHGVAGGIQVSQAVYDRLKTQYLFEERALILIKGRGELPTYLLQGKMSE